MQFLVLTLAAKAVPIFALIFVISLIVYKLYINVRSRFDITVNCWFCNGNTRVPFPQRNSWTCPCCDQYNGFNADGDYNCDIFSQHDCSKTANDPNCSRGSSGASSSTICANAYYASGLAAQQPPVENGLCEQCNEAQRLKIEKLAQFEPRRESRFDYELKLYQKELEQKFRLCSSCERHVNKVLHEKKKMVLGSKFLNFIMKGAALLKQPHFQRIARAEQQRRLARYEWLMKLLTILNILCLLWSLPTATREQFDSMLDVLPSKVLYFLYSHTLTVFHLLVDQAIRLLDEQPQLSKLKMFANTIGKLIIYSVGMSPTQLAQATFSSCFTSIYPYAMLALSLISNIIDGFKFTRFTALIVLWSVYAKSSVLLSEVIGGVTFFLMGSVLTLILLIATPSSPLLQMSTGDSFHRLYADECPSDDETISMLSQQLSYNASNSSNMSLPPDGTRCNSPLCHSPQLRSLGQHNISSNNISHNNSRSNNALGVLSLDSLHLSTQRTPINRPLASPAPTHVAPSPMYVASSLDQHAWSRNYAMQMNAMNMGQPNGWQRAAPSRVPQFECGVDQRTMSRSAHNLLFPSRLQMQRNGDITAWVDAASGNQHPELLQEPTTANLMHCSYNRDMSRTSSQSSGFESQLGNNQARPEAMPSPQPLWGGSRTQAPELQQQQQQQEQQQQEQQQPVNGMFDYAWSDQRSIRVPPPMSSPYSRQSEFGRTAAGQGCVDYRTGDLLRRWMGGRSGLATPKTNR